MHNSIEMIGQMCHRLAYQIVRSAYFQLEFLNFIFGVKIMRRDKENWQSHFSNCVCVSVSIEQMPIEWRRTRKLIPIAQRQKKKSQKFNNILSLLICVRLFSTLFFLYHLVFYGSHVQTFLDDFSLCWNVCVLKWNGMKWNDVSHFR